MTSTANRKRQPAGITIGGQFATEAKAESDVTLAPAQSWGSTGLREGSRTPWGRADIVSDIAEGITQVATPSHGGIKLTPRRNKLVPEALRNSDGWYEEDIESSIVCWVFPEDYAAYRQRASHGQDDKWTEPGFVREDAARALRSWLPEKWEQATGETVTAEQSFLRAEQLFRDKHANDHVAVSASYSTDHPGMVEVSTTIGGARPGWDQDWADMGERRFLVPKEEYDARGALGFVVDPARHTDITPPAAPPRQPAPRLRSARIDRTRLTPAQQARVDKDLATPWRLADGSVKTLADIIETEGVTGKGGWVTEDGSATYCLQQRKYTDSSSYTTLPVSKATFDALVDIPDVRTETDLALAEVTRAQAARDKAGYDPRFLGSAEQRRAAHRAREKAEQRLAAAHARLRELNG